MSFFGEFGFFRFRPAAVLKVTGPDSQSFLQGQFTQELKVNYENAVAYGLWLNQKGKVLADSFVLRESPEAWWVVSFFSPAATLRARLEAYLIADEVDLDDVTEAWEGYVLGGSEAGARLAQFGGLPPENAFSRITEGFLFRGRRAANETWEWLLPRDKAEETLRRLGGGRELTLPEVEEARIAAGIPAIPRDIGSSDLPNEGGLEQSAISYTKGCYLGQEVMARLKNMGQVRRRLMRVRIAGELPAAMPAELWARGKKVGDVRSAAMGKANGSMGLAMISLVGIGAEKTLSFSADGPLVVEIQGFAHE